MNRQSSIYLSKNDTSYNENRQLLLANGIGGINNVGTAQGHCNKGYAKQLIAYLINKFENLGGGILTLSTEYYSKNQQFYEKLGFREKYVMEQYMK